MLKQKHRGMKTLLSIGGWTYTHEKDDMENAMHSPEGRTRFVFDAVELVKNFGFDGVDVDWEYPKNEDQANDFVLLLKELRHALNTYSEKFANGYHFLITIACPATVKDYGILHLQEMDKYINSWHVMTYDFCGPWSPISSHHSNLYTNGRSPENTPSSGHAAVSGYISAGISPRKIVVGMPLYGRSFTNTDGLGSAHGEQAETVEYKDLPKAGAVEHFDGDAVATYSYDPQTREWITYQGKEETKVKAQYIKANKLGGAMWWEVSEDKQGDESLISTALESMGTLENVKNLLHYPESKYENIRNVQPKQESIPDGTKEKLSEEHDQTAEEALVAMGHLLGLW